MVGGELPNGGKVSNKDLYLAILEQNEARERLRDEIRNDLTDIKVCIAGQEERIKTNTVEIKNLRDKSNLGDIAVAIAAAITSAIAALIGYNK